jgi:hypothetical protein
MPLVFHSNTLNILTHSHLSSHLLAVLAELKTTPIRTNLSSVIQICIYDSRSNKSHKTSKNKTVMIVSRVASKSIQNMNETEDSNKNRNEMCKMMKQHANIFGYVETILQETRTTERK